ncbi:MAG: hypothetical protein KTR20_12250 [Cellvibrionaceae bacterium]|nr:hypothetical protein [Cellvibrionaceae bacterium]
MGGGSSSSSSSNTSVVETDNSNIQQNDNQVALNLEDVGDNNSFTLTDSGAIEKAFEFGGDALDFGRESLTNSQEFGRDILSEASEISREAIQVAGNAQTNAFKKIKDIAASFTNSTDTNTKTILLVIGGAVSVIGLVLFFNKNRK